MCLQLVSLERESLFNRLSSAKISLEILGDLGFWTEEAPQRRASNRWDFLFTLSSAVFSKTKA